MSTHDYEHEEKEKHSSTGAKRASESEDVPCSSPGDREHGGTDAVGSIYFIEAPGAGLVKIGWTGNLKQRLASLRYEIKTKYGCEAELIGFLPAPPDTEAALHEIFADFRISGEWYRRDVIQAMVDFGPFGGPRFKDHRPGAPVISKEEEKAKDAAATLLGRISAAKLTTEQRTERARKGGLSGGRSRATSLTPERRSEIARMGALARIKKHLK